MNKTRLSFIVGSIALLALSASLIGSLTFLIDGEAYPYITYRGEVVHLFGDGIYRHMGITMAHQGAAQDLVTLFVAVPLLILATFKYVSAKLKHTVVLAGIVAYFAVTYTLYLFMATYSEMFLIYVLLAGLSVNLLIYLLYQVFKMSGEVSFMDDSQATYGGLTLMGIASVMGLLWLSIIIPSAIDRAATPKPLDHYTTLVVQGADLAFFLPWVFLSGYYAFKKRLRGFVFMNVAMVFLSILMLALSAKIVAAMILGETGLPAIVIMPLFMMLSLGHVLWFMRLQPSKNHG